MSLALVGMKVLEYSFFEPGEGKSLVDQHFKQITEKINMSLKCGKSIMNPKDLGLALKGLQGETFQVLVLNRDHIPKTDPIKNLHVISHVSYKYDGDNCLGITFLQQSLGIESFSGTFIKKEELNKLWKNGSVLESTKASSYDPLSRDYSISEITQNVPENQVANHSTSNQTYSTFIKKKKKNSTTSLLKVSHKKIVRHSKFKPKSYICTICRRSFLKNSSYFRIHCRKCIKNKYEEKCAIDQIKQLIEITKGNFSVANSNPTQNLEIDLTIPLIELGFAKTPPITRTQFSTEQKAYLIQLFHEGIQLRRKYTADDASKMMAGVCDPLEPSQIKSFWSRYNKKLNDQKKATDPCDPLKIVQTQSPSTPQLLGNGISSGSSHSDHLNIAISNKNPSGNATNAKQRKLPTCKICRKSKKGHPKVCPKLK